MVTVLVTGASGVGGSATVRTLRDRTDHEVVAVDMAPSPAALVAADRMRAVPPAASDEWVPEMAAVVEEFDADAVVPLVEEELVRLDALAEAVPDDVAFVAPRAELVEKTTDKYAFARLMGERGLAAPNTYLGSEAADVPASDFPAMVKPRRGRGSDGVTRVDDRNDLQQRLAAADRDPDDLIVQAYVEGTEYTTSVVATSDDDLLAVVPKQVIEKRGNTYRGVTRSRSAVVRSCRAVADELRPHGPLNVQQVVDDESGDAYTIEINPRFSSTACLTVAAGVNELDLLVREFRGESVAEPEGFTEGVHLVRHTDELFVTDRELDSLRRKAEDSRTTD